MWRRFSASSTDSSSPPKQPSTNQPPPPPPSTPVSATPKSATSLAEHQPQLVKPQTNPSVASKEHELASQRPAGAGQRRRSSLLEKWTRESTKEGITYWFSCGELMCVRAKHDSLYSVSGGRVAWSLAAMYVKPQVFFMIEKVGL
jgi:hypothetical protein